MASGRIKGITIEFDGNTTKLGKALKDIDSKTRDLNKELKQVDNALKFNPTNIELWRQKQQLLNEKVDDTKKRLTALKDAQKKMDSSQVDKTSDEYRELQREIITTNSKLKSFQWQLAEVGNANLKALSEQFKNVGDKLTNAGSAMTTKVTAPIAAGYTAAAKYASDYEENLNKIDVAFGKNSKSVKDWANTARAEYGLSKVQATEAVSAFGALSKGIGLTEGQASEMSTTLAGLSSDLGSYFNVGTDESAKALEGIFTGESEALKKFGVVMTDTNLKKFAEDQGLVWNELDQTEKTMLRYQFVLANTKDAQGDFARTSDGTANSTKIFKAAIQDLATSIGTNLLPIITPVIQKITSWINKFNELSPETQKIITIIGLAVAAIGPLLIIIGKVATGIGSIISLVNLMGGAVGVFSAGSLLPIIGIIAAVVAAGVWLYKNWDTVKKYAAALGKKISEVWNSIKTKTINTWNTVKDAIVSPFKWAYDKIKSIIDKIRGWFPIKLGNLFKGIKLPHFDIDWGTITAFGRSIDYPRGFDIDWYDKGGIFDSPSVIGVGEKRPEFVGALDDLRQIVREESGTGEITINVYAAPGMDVNQIALKVEQRLVQLLKQRSKAYGNI